MRRGGQTNRDLQQGRGLRRKLVREREISKNKNRISQLQRNFQFPRGHRLRRQQPLLRRRRGHLQHRERDPLPKVLPALHQLPSLDDKVVHCCIIKINYAICPPRWRADTLVLSTSRTKTLPRATCASSRPLQRSTQL